MTRYTSVCQWCGKRGSSITTANDKVPYQNPSVIGTCPSHPSGNPKMAHGPRWEKN